MFWRRKRSLRDFTEELQSHISIEGDHLAESGETDAAARARREFGNLTSFQERFYERDRWQMWDHLSRDLRHALRLAWRRPGFSAVVVFTLALGIGANTAIFSLIHAVLLRPLPYRDSGRLAMLWMDDAAHEDHEGRVSLLNFRDWKQQSHSFQDMTFYIGQTFLLGTDGPPERMRSARVRANFFPMLGVEPVLGRVFSQDEEDRRERVVVLSHRMWQQRFGGSPEAIGKDLVMDGRKLRIIGVMPRGFQYPFADTQVWEPITAHPYWSARDQVPSFNVWYVLARLRPEATWPQAQSEMNAIERRIQAQYPERKAPPAVRVVPLQTQTTGPVRQSLWILFGSVMLMLLIACINVANLLLARGSTRGREFAVRRALGAGRLRMAAQLLTESLVLAGAGGMVGLSLAEVGIRALIAFGPRDIPRLAEARLDPPVLAFTVILSLLSAILAGVWPAVRGSTPLTRSRQWNTRADRSVRNLLVTGEFALALVLLTGAGLMIHSFLRLASVDPGFRPEHLLTMRIDLHVGRTREQMVNYFRNAIEGAQALPGVRSAGAISQFLESDASETVAVEGRPEVAGGGTLAADDLVSGPYFQTVGVALKKGRYFTDQDRAGALPVAIVNEAMARSCWPAEDAMGRRFRFPDRKGAPWITVVGVVGDMRREGMDRPAAPQIFRPHSQDTDNEMDLLVRTESDPLTLAATVRAEVQSMDGTVPKFGVTTVTEQLGQETAERRFDTSLIGLFSLIALFLSAIGIFSLMHYFVVQRTNEIGVRMALGARYGDVLGLVLRQGLTLAGGGILAGVAGALMLTRMLSSLLYGVTATDPAAFAVAPSVLLGVAVLACWVPARRAARIDPVQALRQD